MGDGEKLLTHLNSALKVLLGLDIFPRVPKKKSNFVDQCNYTWLKGRCLSLNIPRFSLQIKVNYFNTEYINYVNIRTRG